MENTQTKILEFEKLAIAAFAERTSGEKCPIYYPCNVLYHVYEGKCQLVLNQQSHLLDTGSFFLIRKYTFGYKAFPKSDDGKENVKMLVFGLQDRFLREIVQKIPIQEGPVTIAEKAIELPPNQLLKGLMHSVRSYISDDEQLDYDIVLLKTKEALLAILKANPKLISIFREFTRSEKANLENLMNYNFTYNYPLSRFAELSGRSLSSFNRDFRRIFHMPPRKWLMKRRLQEAQKILLQSTKTATEICLMVGFENLAHFSRAFKSEFGRNVSQWRAANK